MTVRDTLKKSIASQDHANHLREIKVEIKVQLVNPFGTAKGTTYPEKKRPHCVKVRLLRTSHNGLVRSVFSLFGRRFRKKYGAIGGKFTGNYRSEEDAEAGEGGVPDS